MYGNLVRNSIVSRNDLVYEIHPDIVRTKSGKIICIYRESDSHDPREFSTLVYRVSLDGGNSWGERKLLADSRGKDRKYDCLKCPRISQISDGRVVIICDMLPDYESPKTTPIAPSFLWWSDDDGETWSEPQATSIRGIVPDKVSETPGGALRTAAHYHLPNKERIIATYRSEDGGKSWQDPVPIFIDKDNKYAPTEPSIVKMGDNTLVCYLRSKTPSGLKCISHDDGRTWEGPYPTLMPNVHGRPAAGVLKSGKILVTYRYRNKESFFGYLESQESALSTKESKQNGRLIAIAHQSRGGAGYTGWVQLPSEEILHVGALEKDARKYYIEAHRFWERDI